MNKLLATLIGSLLAASAYAQMSATSPAIGQAVSGNNATAGGTSGTGLRTDGTAQTPSHAAIAREAAGVNAKGETVGPGTAVIGTTPQNRDKTNAEATYATPQGTPAISAKGPVATDSGDPKARQELKQAGKTQAKTVGRKPNKKTPVGAHDKPRNE